MALCNMNVNLTVSRQRIESLLAISFFIQLPDTANNQAEAIPLLSKDDQY